MPATTEISLFGFQFDLNNLNRGQQALNNVAGAGENAAQSQTLLQRSLIATNQRFTIARNSAQQLGFQIQDIAVQAQMGTHALTIIGQQASQLLGIFGAAGALTGAIVATAAAIGTALLPVLFNTKTATEQLEEALENLSETFVETEDGAVILTDTFDKLSRKSKELATFTLKNALNENAKAVSATFSQLEEALDDVSGRLDSFTKRTFVNNSALENQRNELARSARSVRRFTKDFGLTIEQAKEFDKAFIEAFKLPNLENVNKLSIVLREISEESDKTSVEFDQFALTISKGAQQLRDLNEQAAFGRKQLKDLADGTELVTEKTIADAEEREKAAEKTNKAIDRQLDVFFRAEERQSEIDARAAERLKKKQEREALAASKREERMKQQASRELDAVSRMTMSQEELIRDSHIRRQEIIDRNAQLGNITEERAAELRLEINRKMHAELEMLEGRREQSFARNVQARLAMITSSSKLASIAMSAETDAVAAQFGKLSGLMNSESKKAFKIGKTAAIAEATIKGVQAAISSFAAGAAIGGPIVGTAFAAISAASTGAMIAQIKAQQPPGRAQGGQLRPRSRALVGEHGPEIIETGDFGGFVTPNNRLENMPMGNNIEVLANVNIIGGDRNAKVTTSSTKVNDRKFVIDVMVEQFNNGSSQPMQTLQQKSNLKLRGTR